MIASNNVSGKLGILAIAIVCGLLFLIAGCADDQNVQLLGNPSALMADIPIPSDFDLEEDSSRMWTDGTLRYADMLYAGRASINAVQKFYNQQMATCHWTAQSEQFAQGRATLDYIKNSEKCRISIYKTGSFNQINIHVVIWPHRPNAKIKPKSR